MSTEKEQNRSRREQELFEAKRFINTMCGPLGDGELVAISMPLASKQPGFPITEAEFQKRFPRSGGELGNRAYVSTAVLNPTDVDGTPVILNRMDAFVRLPFFILDDIGTRCQIDDLPQLLRKPTSIVESSAGNYQFGFKLAEPITDPVEAALFIRAVYGAGGEDGWGWDSGGATAAKYVRLPAGVHGKTDFHCRLVELHQDRVFNYKEIAEAAGVDLGSPEIRARRAVMRQSVEAGNHDVNGEGIADPLLEFFYRESLAYSDDGAWVSILCPWHSEHNNGAGANPGATDSLARYAPVGRGDDERRLLRGFKCFHNSCSGHSTRELLNKLRETYGYRLDFPTPLYDHAAPLVRDWIYDRGEDRVANLVTSEEITTKAFNESFPKRIGGPGSPTFAQLWKEHPMRTVVRGSAQRPDLDTALFTDGVGLPTRNSYQRPPWGDVEVVDEAAIQPWLAFVEFLFPAEDDRHYLLCWMGNKLLDPTFRGNTLLCITEAEGTGRDTFWDIFRTLLGEANCIENDFDDVVGRWDDYMQKLFAYCGETSDHGSRDTNKYKAANNLKRKCDPRPKKMELNLKSLGKREQWVFTSQVLGSNLSDAVVLRHGNRRIAVLLCAAKPHPDSDYYIQLNEWVDAGGWQDHLFTWLRRYAREHDDWDGFAPAPENAGFQMMVDATTGPIGKAVEEVIMQWPSEYVARAQVVACFEWVRRELDDRYGRHKWETQVEHEFYRHVDRRDKLGKVDGEDARPQVAMPEGLVKKTAYRIKYPGEGGYPTVVREFDFAPLRAEVREIVEEG